MKKIINISLILVVLLNISCIKIKNEFSDIETYELEGTWELYEGENKIKKIIFDNNKVSLKTENKTIHGKLTLTTTSSSSVDVIIYTKTITKSIPTIEYFKNGKKVAVPIVYENINDESFITLNDIVYQKIK